MKKRIWVKAHWRKDPKSGKKVYVESYWREINVSSKEKKGKVLYDSGDMSVGGKRYRVKVRKTGNGIAVDTDSLYSDERPQTRYYYDGNYPELPNDWDEIVDKKWYITAKEKFLDELQYYEPDRVKYR